MISSASGKRCSAYFENKSVSFRYTSKIPFEPFTSWQSRPLAFLISAANLTA